MSAQCWAEDSFTGGFLFMTALPGDAQIDHPDTSAVIILGTFYYLNINAVIYPNFPLIIS